MRRTSIRFVLAIAAVAVLAGTAAAAVAVSRTFQMPMHLDLSVGTSGCDNSPGPQITLDGEMALAGMGTDLVFSNNAKGTHTLSVVNTVEAAVVPDGQSVVLPKQPVLGGVGGNPYIWLQLTDESGRALTSEIYLGRCVQGALHADADLALPVTAEAAVSTTDCDNSPGPYITLDGALTLTGLNGTLIFRNSDNPVGGPHSADRPETMMVTLLPSGQAIRFPKQPVLGGVGGNPWISMSFTQADGEEIGSASSLGRCVQLSQ